MLQVLSARLGRSGAQHTSKEEAEALLLRLYIAGNATRSRRALELVTDLCAGCLAGRARLEVIDVRRDPELSREAGLIGLPTLVREHPPPRRCIVGELSDELEVLAALGIAPSP